MTEVERKRAKAKQEICTIWFEGAEGLLDNSYSPDRSQRGTEDGLAEWLVAWIAYEEGKQEQQVSIEPGQIDRKE